VTAVNGIGESVASNEVNAIPATIATPPQSLTAAAGNHQVVLNWQAPASTGGGTCCGYNIYRGTSPNTETFHDSAPDVTTYTDVDGQLNAVTNGVTYYYRITARNTAGESALSNE